MECTIRTKKVIHAYKWDGNEKAVKKFLKELFVKIENDKLYVTAEFPCQGSYDEYIIVLDIGDWIILDMNDDHQRPFKCTPEEFRNNYYII
jgi:hypothetical protein